MRRWWHSDGEPTAERVDGAYGPRIDGMTPTRMWVVEVNGRSVGLRPGLPDRATTPSSPLLAPDPDAIGVDYAIGEPEWMRARARRPDAVGVDARTRTGFPDATTYFAAPDHRNAASLRMLAKAGLHRRASGSTSRRRDGTTATVVGCTLDVRRGAWAELRHDRP